MIRRILHVVSNVANYADQTEPTGLWLSELTHAWHVFSEKGYRQQIVSPKGGVSPLEPRSLKWPLADASVKEWLNDRSRQALLSATARADQIDPADFDAIYFTGGHAVMWDFPDDEPLQRVTRDIYERGGIVSSVCHGYCGLLNTRLSNGALLVAGRRLTGYSWIEEVLDSMRRRSFFAHVLALPVTTEIARVRGVYGYQLPKWLAGINVDLGTSVEASISALDGKPDLVLSAPPPALQSVKPQSHIGTSTMVHVIDGEWHQTSIQTNTLSFAQRVLPRNVKLVRGGGPLSQLLDGLGVSTIVRFDVVKDAQVVLNLPARLRTFA